MRNMGFKQNIFYCIDESFFRIKDEIVLNFIKTSKELTDPNNVAKYVLK
jgi:hypothetical protein